MSYCGLSVTEVNALRKLVYRMKELIEIPELRSTNIPLMITYDARQGTVTIGLLFTTKALARLVGRLTEEDAVEILTSIHETIGKKEITREDLAEILGVDEDVAEKIIKLAVKKLPRIETVVEVGPIVERGDVASSTKRVRQEMQHDLFIEYEMPKIEYTIERRVTEGGKTVHRTETRTEQDVRDLFIEYEMPKIEYTIERRVTEGGEIRSTTETTSMEIYSEETVYDEAVVVPVVVTVPKTMVVPVYRVFLIPLDVYEEISMGKTQGVRQGGGQATVHLPSPPRGRSSGVGIGFVRRRRQFEEVEL